MRIECHWFAPDWGDGADASDCGRRASRTSIASSTRTCSSREQIQQSVESPGFRGMTLELPGAPHLPLARGTRSAHRPRGPVGAGVVARQAAARAVPGELSAAHDHARRHPQLRRLPAAPASRAQRDRGGDRAGRQARAAARRAGTRSYCNWDEDSLTMAVDAARDCLAGSLRTRSRRRVAVRLDDASVRRPLERRPSSPRRSISPRPLRDPDASRHPARRRRRAAAGVRAGTLQPRRRAGGRVGPAHARQTGQRRRKLRSAMARRRCSSGAGGDLAAELLGARIAAGATSSITIAPATRASTTRSRSAGCATRAT